MSKAASMHPSQIRYSPQQHDSFVEMAAKYGVTAAVQTLGYPTIKLGYIWMERSGLKAPKALLSMAAAQIDGWYGDAERRLVGQQLLDAIHEDLTSGRQLTSQDLNYHTSSYKSVLTTLALLDGTATEIIDQNITVQPELLNAIEELKQRNQAQITAIRATAERTDKVAS